MHVLLVEDEPIIAITLRHDLEDHGYRVSHVARGDEAVARLAAGRFDAVVTDLRLPGADGTEVIRAARCADPDAKVLLITAYAPQGLSSASPAHEILRKPFCNDAVIRWLAAACR